MWGIPPGNCQTPLRVPSSLQAAGKQHPDGTIKWLKEGHISMQNEGDNSTRNLLVVTDCLIISLVSLEAAHLAWEEKRSFFEPRGEFTQAIKT